MVYHHCCTFTSDGARIEASSTSSVARASRPRFSPSPVRPTPLIALALINARMSTTSLKPWSSPWLLPLILAYWLQLLDCKERFWQMSKQDCMGSSYEAHNGHLNE
ncbi:hypothetical protein TorRG33x02_239440 [Trema orientale]|uniref:Uncharacterized protein n=1 Tax=Trema orientale TaxID=63057 RepID=A0A2P5DX14_TREOI|nr:hypothetical protein TorRG33x02_239440 [Trema orientale]